MRTLTNIEKIMPQPQSGSSFLPLLLLTALMLTGCGGSKENTAEKHDYPDFIPNATPASYDPEELASNVHYPEEARDEGAEAKVLLLVTLLKTGEVSKIEVLRTEPEEGKFRDAFIDAATRAVRRTTFTPATQNGIAISYRMTVRVTFALE